MGKPLEVMEIPAGSVCNPFDKDGQHYGCPLRLDTHYCRAFAKQVRRTGLTEECFRCYECLSAYPNGATITITSREVK